MNYAELKISDDVLFKEGEIITLSSNFLIASKILINTSESEDYGDMYCADVYCVANEAENTGTLFFKPYTDRSLEKHFFYKGDAVKDVLVTFKWSDDAEGKRLYKFTTDAVVMTLSNNCDLVAIHTMLPNRSLTLAAKVFFVEMYSWLEDAKTK